MGGDGSVDLGFGVGANYLNRLCAANGNQAAASDAGNNMEIIQRLNAMLEGNLDLGSMADVTPKRSYQQGCSESVCKIFCSKDSDVMITALLYCTQMPSCRCRNCSATA